MRKSWIAGAPSRTCGLKWRKGMLETPKQTTAARALVDQLMIHGVDRVFCVPGESFLPVLDAFYERSLATTIFRNEGGASMAADAYAKATGRPGVCFVTRGPGASNAFAGVHVARHNSDPLILFIGQVKRSVKDREAFQEVDYRAMFGGHAKWTAEIDDARRIPEYLSHAFQVATSGRPGPVVLSLPCDMLEEEVSTTLTARYLEIEASPALEDMARLATMIEQSSRPLLIWEGRGGARTRAGKFTNSRRRSISLSPRATGVCRCLTPCIVATRGISVSAPIRSSWTA